MSDDPDDAAAKAAELARAQNDKALAAGPTPRPGPDTYYPQPDTPSPADGSIDRTRAQGGRGVEDIERSMRNPGPVASDPTLPVANPNDEADRGPDPQVYPEAAKQWAEQQERQKAREDEAKRDADLAHDAATAPDHAPIADEPPVHPQGSDGAAENKADDPPVV
jgi:hypothetical protein